MARRRKKLPTEAVEATIESLSHEGRGIAHINDKISFIRGALPGEKVLFKYTNQRAKFDEGIITEVLQASGDRVTAKCEHYGICGGCSMQHLNSSSQIMHKQAILIEQLEHSANVIPDEILPPLTSNIWGYRKKARLGVKFVQKKAKVLIGFREVNSSFIADISQCEVLDPAVGKQLLKLQSLIESLSIKDKVPQLEVAIGEANTVIILRHLVDLSNQDIENLKTFEAEFDIEFYLQPGGPNTIKKLSPNSTGKLFYTIPNHNITIEFNATDFTQINTEINQAMIDRAINYLKLNKDDIVLDLFCGLGNFTLPIAKYSKQVTGIEGEQTLVEQARLNARLNNISNAEFVTMDLAQENLEAEFIHKDYNKLLLDPARSGADQILLRLPMAKIETIVYISCNPATLARDSKILVHDKGFKLSQAGVMDMFPHTSHVESIAVFKR